MGSTGNGLANAQLCCCCVVSIMIFCSKWFTVSVVIVSCHCKMTPATLSLAANCLTCSAVDDGAEIVLLDYWVIINSATCRYQSRVKCHFSQRCWVFTVLLLLDVRFSSNFAEEFLHYFDQKTPVFAPPCIYLMISVKFMSFLCFSAALDFFWYLL